MSDIYQAPEAELSTPTEVGEYGSVEQAVLGNYEFDIGEVLSEAWGKVSGTKLNFFLCSLVYFVVVILLSLPSTLMTEFGDPSLSLTVVFQILTTALVMPIGIGFALLGARVSMGADFSVKSLFSYYPKTLKLFLTYILASLILVIAFLLFIIPGIYLSIAYLFVFSLIAEKNLGIWEAMEVSRKSISKRWFAVFGLGIVTSLIIFVGFIIPFGLIWFLPLVMISWGILYRNMFGVEPETLELP